MGLRQSARWGGKRPALFVLVAVAAAALILGSTQSSATGDEGNRVFRLDGTAQKAQDPENPANDVIKIDSTLAPGQCVAPTYLNCPVGTVSRRLNVQVAALDHQLEFKSYFQAPKTCSAGIPRMTLLVDADGDGDFQQFPASPDFAAHGHVNPPTFAGCLPNIWRYDDFTDALGRWEVTPATAFPTIGNFPYDPWDAFEAAVTTSFPQHRVCSGFLIDANEASAGQTGVAFYDVITIGNATYANHRDIAGRGFAGCRLGGGGHGDNDDDDDDHDGKHDEDDEDDDGDGHHDGDDDDDDDNDGIDDAWDSGLTFEDESSQSLSLSIGQATSYVTDAAATTLSVTAVLADGQAMSAEIVNPSGVVVAKSLPIAGRAIVTAITLVPGSYTVRVSNAGLTPTNSVVKVIRSDRWF